LGEALALQACAKAQRIDELSAEQAVVSAMVSHSGTVRWQQEVCVPFGPAVGAGHEMVLSFGGKAPPVQTADTVNGPAHSLPYVHMGFGGGGELEGEEHAASAPRSRIQADSGRRPRGVDDVMEATGITPRP
jgi:hypothetical protein